MYSGNKRTHEVAQPEKVNENGDKQSDKAKGQVPNQGKANKGDFKFKNKTLKIING